MNTIKKTIPCALCDITGLEQWLEEQAVQGHLFQYFTAGEERAVFQVGDPVRRRYRLDPMGRDYDPEARKDWYSQFGWQYAATVSRLFCLFYCDDPACPDLHTDLQVLAGALDGLIRQRRRALIVMWAVPAALFAFLFLTGGMGSFLLELLLYPEAALLLWSSPLLLLTLSTTRGIHDLHRLRRAKEALSLGDRPPAGRYCRVIDPRVTTGILLALLLLSRTASGSIHDPKTQLFQPLDTAALSRSYPTLSQVEATGGQSRPSSHVELTGYVNRSFTAPVQELAAQHSPFQFVDARYVQCTSPRLAQWVWQALQSDQAVQALRYPVDSYDGIPALRDLTQGKTMEFQERTDPNFDRLAVAVLTPTPKGQSGAWCFAALRGDRVLMVTHEGAGDLNACLDLYAPLLTES